MPRRRASRLPFDFTLDRHTAHGIVTVAIFAVAILLFLSLFELAGRFGVAVDAAVAHALGWQRLALPIFLLAIGIHEVSPQRLPLKVTQYIGFVFFFLSLNPLAHTISGVGMNVASTLGTRGGKLGLLLSEPIVNILGRAGAITALGALFFVSLLLIFNTSIRSVGEKLAWFLATLVAFVRALGVPFRWILSKRVERKEKEIRSAVALPAEPMMTQEDSDVATDLHEALAERATDDDDAPEHRVHVVPPRPRKRHPKVDVPIELLMKRDQKPTSGDIISHQNVIRRTLEMFGIPVEMRDVAVGPTVTQFTLKPAEGVKLSKITALHNDLALALAAHPIRIEAPIPGKSLVGIEVPNQSVATVGIREMLETREWRERRGALPFVLGRDVTGRPWIGDLGRMPHLLVAGATGSGKSVCLNILLTSLLYSYGPDDLKCILVDPKRIELQVYNGIPHLVTPVITDVEKTVNALLWALREMDRRFDMLSKFGSRDLASYNARSDEKIPNLVIVIDELADLMVTAMQNVEGPIVRLAQMSRAVGIHLVLATQRPSVDVITGLIKANIPARIACAVASSTDSRTILDAVGAEKLLGRG
ncbi:MAG: DNA translocase FtsK 4TM domain-containing protein, partial [Patescibacteria group bacterium]